MEQIFDSVSTLCEQLNIDLAKVAATLSYDPASPLLFNTGLFLMLFALFIACYRLLRPWRTARMLFTIAFSLYFYYKSSGLCTLILAGVAVSDWVLGLLMARTASTLWRRCIVAVNITVNVGMLAYFKYFNLIIETFNRFATSHIDPVALILPAGISFFTFRSISYIVDIYRGTLKPCRSLLDYMFFLTFFPPLLAGPVVRAKDMLPQIAADQGPTRDMVSEGIWLLILGIIKKMVIADFISGNFVDRVFDNPALYSGFENLMASFGFTIQLYCDFSGYSDMAIGIALLLGFRFKENFNAPFKAQNPTEFWHRWHISLSTWLRDYVYIPLGGNRCGRVRRNLNLFITMVVGGFWHGASWMYVIWGMAHGILLICHKTIRVLIPVRATVVSEAGGTEMMVEGTPKTPGNVNRLMRLVNILITFLLVSLTFLVFRSSSMENVEMMLTQIFTNFHASVAPQFVEGYLAIVLVMAAAFIIHILPDSISARMRGIFFATPVVIQALMLCAALFVAIQVRSSDIVPFIYLQY